MNLFKHFYSQSQPWLKIKYGEKKALCTLQLLFCIDSSSFFCELHFPCVLALKSTGVLYLMSLWALGFVVMKAWWLKAWPYHYMCVSEPYYLKCLSTYKKEMHKIDKLHHMKGREKREEREEGKESYISLCVSVYLIYNSDHQNEVKFRVRFNARHVVRMLTLGLKDWYTL